MRLAWLKFLKGGVYCGGGDCFNEIYLLMRNNLQWFQSPRPSSFNFAQTHQQQEQFPELTQINPNNLTPTSIVHHSLSPFNPIAQTDKTDQFHPHSQHEEGKNRGINHLVVFSQQEDDDGEVLTPEHQPKNNKNEEALTTGRKSSVQRPHGVKKSRPKDKGLRGLSLKALHTVIAMRQGTYKEVATRLLAGFEEQGDGQKAANEQTNIKRRVYDALNVLISLGLLKKVGRLIVGERNPITKKKQDIKEYNRLKNKLAIKEFILEEKRDKLRETEEKYRGIQGLFKANQANYQLVHQQQTFIPFPFIGVLTTDSWSVFLQKEDELELRFRELVHPFGDIDSLRALKKHFK